MLDQLIAELTDAECTCCSRPGQPCAYCTAMDKLVEHAKETTELLQYLWDRYLLPINPEHKRRIQQALGEIEGHRIERV